MKLYTATCKKGYGNDTVQYSIVAATIAKALDKAEKLLRKNYYSTSRVLCLQELQNDIEVVK